MKSDKKPARKPPGRPRKAEADKLEQFSIRLSPKLKFGLELLARAQGRSLSQAVEWAIQVGLNNFRVNNEWASVADIVNAAWDQEEAFDRVLAIYNASPNLVGFEDRAGCEIVERSLEWEYAHESAGTYSYVKDVAPERQGDAHRELVALRKSIFYDFVRAYWPTIKKLAEEHFSAGKPYEGKSLLSLLDLRGKLVGVDDFALMKMLTEVTKRKMTHEEMATLVIELDQTYVWSRKHKRR